MKGRVYVLEMPTVHPPPPRKALIPGRLGEMLRCFLSTAWGVSAKP